MKKGILIVAALGAVEFSGRAQNAARCFNDGHVAGGLTQGILAATTVPSVLVFAALGVASLLLLRPRG
ncbi:MAG TPA: hypothetical protein VMH30_01475 [Verrucomicrobiae bacterium]|jgi:hypothetical protein|nr:hypothetical protein [Verrucomicrobiae bacterium]